MLGVVEGRCRAGSIGCLLTGASSGTSSLRSRFEHMAKSAEEESRRQAEEERARQQPRGHPVPRQQVSRAVLLCPPTLMTQNFPQSLAAPCPSVWCPEGNLLPKLQEAPCILCICQEWPLSFTVGTGLLRAPNTHIRTYLHPTMVPVLWPQLLLALVPGKQCGYCSPALPSQQSACGMHPSKLGMAGSPCASLPSHLVLFLHSEDRGMVTVKLCPRCSFSGLPNCCHQPVSAQAQSRFVGGGKCSELLCWECEQSLFKGTERSDGFSPAGNPSEREGAHWDSPSSRASEGTHEHCWGPACVTRTGATGAWGSWGGEQAEGIAPERVCA